MSKATVISLRLQDNMIEMIDKAIDEMGDDPRQFPSGPPSRQTMIRDCIVAGLAVVRAQYSARQTGTKDISWTEIEK